MLYMYIVLIKVSKLKVGVVWGVGGGGGERGREEGARGDIGTQSCGKYSFMDLFQNGR